MRWQTTFRIVLLWTFVHLATWPTSETFPLIQRHRTSPEESPPMMIDEQEINDSLALLEELLPRLNETRRILLEHYGNYSLLDDEDLAELNDLMGWGNRSDDTPQMYLTMIKSGVKGMARAAKLSVKIGFKIARTALKQMSKAGIRALKASAKYMKKIGMRGLKKNLKALGKSTVKGFKTSMAVVEKAVEVVNLGLDVYNLIDEIKAKQRELEEMRAEDHLPYNEDEEDNDSPLNERKLQRKPRIPIRNEETYLTGEAEEPGLLGLPFWAIGLVVAACLIIFAISGVGCYITSKRHYDKHKRLGDYDDSDKDDDEENEDQNKSTKTSPTSTKTSPTSTKAASTITSTKTEATSTKTENATVKTEAATTKTETTMTTKKESKIAKPKGKAKGKKKGLSRAIYKMEQSVYGKKTKKSTKAKKSSKKK